MAVREAAAVLGTPGHVRLSHQTKPTRSLATTYDASSSKITEGETFPVIGSWMRHVADWPTGQNDLDPSPPQAANR